MSTTPWTTTDRDAEHLKLLSLFHYIKGGTSAVFSCVFIIYIVMGFFVAAFSHGRNGPPAAMGLLFMIIGVVMVLFGWVWSGLVIYAGHCLARRKHRMYCMVVAGISCVFVPYGTILGIFTLMVLQRPNVRAMFEQPSFPPSPVK